MALRKKHRRGSRPKLVIESSGLYPYLARYLEWLQVKGFSASTATAKDSALRQFIAWCDERSVDTPQVITKPMLERYQRHLFYLRQPNGQPLAFSTQNTALSSVKTWFKWLTQENYIASNPASEVQPIKRPQRLPERVLSQAEVEDILNRINISALAGLRLRTMVEVLYSTGIRRMECCQLQLHDVDTGRRSLFVRQGKGSKDRCIPIGQRALVWVNRYIEQVRPQLITDLHENALFLTDYGEAFSTGMLGHTIRHLLKQAGIDKGGCHLFRHAMATHMLENGAELRYIQAILGHADINTTTVYTHLNIGHLQQVHQQTHPAEQ